MFLKAALLSVLLFSFSDPSLLAQPLDVTINEVDFSTLPRVTFKACVRRDGEIVKGLLPENISLLENGEQRDLIIRCPDPDKINSVVLVLDNSGSIFSALPKLVEAAKILVDSLGPNDVAAIVTFGQNIVVQQGFTTNKLQLKAVLDNMVASGGTAIFSATYRACQLLENQNGNRHAVVLTDGEDNRSTHTLDETIAYANSIDATLHTVAFAIPVDTKDVEDVMKRMAVETGGVFFIVERPSELTAVYKKIADIITEPCCIAEYESADCADTLRSLLLTVSEGGETAQDLAELVSPGRALETTLRVDVPDELNLTATSRGYIEIAPPPNTELSLTMSFTLHYNQDLVEIPTLPFTLGTVVQNQLVQMQKIGRGQMRFTLENITPPFTTNRLVGFSIKALLSDSSRKVGLYITDIDLAGCPTNFTTIPDSTLICQCYQPLALALDSVPTLAADQQVMIPIRVAHGLDLNLPLTANVAINVPPGIENLDILPGNLFAEDAMEWTRDGELIEMHIVTPVFPADTGGVVAYLRIGPNEGKEVRSIGVSIEYGELWQRCCPADSTLPEIHVLQDGNCEFILRRVEPQVEVENAPNPFTTDNGSETHIVFRIPRKYDGRQFTLDVLDSQGRRTQRLYDGQLPEGEHRLRFNAEQLPAGVYHAVLRSGDLVVTRSMLYVR